MMLKIKKFLSVILLLLFATISFPTTLVANADEPQLLTKENVLSMNKSELLSTLEDKGLVLPEDYATHIDMAENFVYKYTPMIMEGKIDTSINLFSYDQSNEMLSNLGTILYDSGLATSKPFYAKSSYTLQDSTPIGLWNNSYLNYNCYAYSLKRTSGLQPGSLSGDYFSLTMSISAMADVVLSDLDSQGYWGYKTTTKPTSLPDKYFKVIAIRKDNSNEDYHFMRLYGSSLNSWAHKPGRTQPLKWNYSSPSSIIWSNEATAYGNTYEPTITYESTVYYIIYKSKSDPGIQPWSVEYIQSE